MDEGNEQKPIDMNQDWSQGTFVRKFRWTMDSKNEPLLAKQLISVSINWTDRTIEIDGHERHYEGGKIPIIDWINGVNVNEVLTFTTYDGCGRALYEYVFKELNVLGIQDSYISHFDYASSDTAKRKIKLYFQDVKYRAFDLEQLNLSQVSDVEEESEVIGKVQFEQTKVSFLNDNIYLSGKLKSSDLTLVSSPQEDQSPENTSQEQSQIQSDLPPDNEYPKETV